MRKYWKGWSQMPFKAPSEKGEIDVVVISTILSFILIVFYALLVNS